MFNIPFERKDRIDLIKEIYQTISNTPLTKEQIRAFLKELECYPELKDQLHQIHIYKEDGYHSSSLGPALIFGLSFILGIGMSYGTFELALFLGVEHGLAMVFGGIAIPVACALAFLAVYCYGKYDDSKCRQNLKLEINSFFHQPQHENHQASHSCKLN